MTEGGPGVCGGSAAYKSCELVRLFPESGHGGRVVPTAAALQFVGAPPWAALSGRPVATEVWAAVHEVPPVRIGRQAEEFAGTGAVGQLEVQVRPLADYLDPAPPGPVLLKIDAQGYELEVLTGAGPALAGIDEVYCECSFLELYEGQPRAGEIISHLHGHGFALAGVFGVAHSLSGEQMQADLLFRNTGKAGSGVGARSARASR